MEKIKFIKPKLVKPKFFLSVPLALFSLEVYFGVIFGYLVAKLLSGKIKSRIFDIGHYKLHLHHWLFGLGILISGLCFNFFSFFPQFFFGFLGGVVFQGISSYPDWHKILIKKKYC